MSAIALMVRPVKPSVALLVVAGLSPPPELVGAFAIMFGSLFVAAVFVCLVFSLLAHRFSPSTLASGLHCTPSGLMSTVWSFHVDVLLYQA